MKVFVFKPTNESIGKFGVESLEITDLERALAKFAETHRVTVHDYLEAAGQTWTVTDDQDRLRIQEGRILPERKEQVSIAGKLPSLERHYVKRYQRAEFAIKTGVFLKVAAVLLAIGTFFVALVTGMQVLEVIAQGISFVQALIAAITTGTPIFIAGVVVGTLGDIHKANLDIAVHGSPYLSDAERARVIGAASG